MYLQTLNIVNFKNIIGAQLELSPNINCFLGDNGMGKSNLLDAIYCLSFGKSFSGVVDAMLITRDEDFCMVNAGYLRHGVEETLSLGMQRGRRKSLRRAGKEYKKLSDHIGKFPLVLVSPADMSLIDGSGEERRRFMDMVISQTDGRYLDMLIRYNHALEQRNRLLRDGQTDAGLYEAIEAGMEMAAAYICEARGRWVRRLADIFRKYYAEIGTDAEVPDLTYKSHLADCASSLKAVLDERRQRDSILKYTSAGPHRDDIEMTLSGMPVRRVASQGQAKTYTIALRFAQYEFLREAAGVAPLLLLDDIFDKLDAGRVTRIIDMVAGDTFGQIFITDTNRKHLDEILSHCGDSFALWSVEEGRFAELNSE
ncbi:MAG: DNA replication/repair protein RecF [Muribaculaceae bacterium]|nr:DNA replication/repair protein RecF [Muribaculaceae bacterium]